MRHKYSIPWFSHQVYLSPDNGGDGASGSADDVVTGTGSSSQYADIDISAQDPVAKAQEYANQQAGGGNKQNSAFNYIDVPSRLIDIARTKVNFVQPVHSVPANNDFPTGFGITTVKVGGYKQPIYNNYPLTDRGYAPGAVMEELYSYIAPFGFKEGDNRVIESIASGATNKITLGTITKVAPDASLVEGYNKKAFLVNNTFDQLLETFVRKVYSMSKFRQQQTYNGIVVKLKRNDFKKLLKAYLMDSFLVGSFAYHAAQEASAAMQLKKIFGEASTLEDTFKAQYSKMDSKVAFIRDFAALAEFVKDHLWLPETFEDFKLMTGIFRSTPESTYGKGGFTLSTMAPRLVLPATEQFIGADIKASNFTVNEFQNGPDRTMSAGTIFTDRIQKLQAAGGAKRDLRFDYSGNILAVMSEFLPQVEDFIDEWNENFGLLHELLRDPDVQRVMPKAIFGSVDITNSPSFGKMAPFQTFPTADSIPYNDQQHSLRLSRPSSLMVTDGATQDEYVVTNPFLTTAQQTAGHMIEHFEMIMPRYSDGFNATHSMPSMLNVFHNADPFASVLSTDQDPATGIEGGAANLDDEFDASRWQSAARLFGLWDWEYNTDKTYGGPVASRYWLQGGTSRRTATVDFALYTSKTDMTKFAIATGIPTHTEVETPVVSIKDGADATAKKAYMPWATIYTQALRRFGYIANVWHDVKGDGASKDESMFAGYDRSAVVDVTPIDVSRYLVAIATNAYAGRMQDRFQTIRPINMKPTTEVLNTVESHAVRL